MYLHIKSYFKKVLVISKGLKEKSVYFISQLMSSDGMRLLRYKDLKYRININIQGRVSG